MNDSCTTPIASRGTHEVHSKKEYMTGQGMLLEILKSLEMILLPCPLKHHVEIPAVQAAANPAWGTCRDLDGAS